MTGFERIFALSAFIAAAIVATARQDEEEERRGQGTVGRVMFKLSHLNRVPGTTGLVLLNYTNSAPIRARRGQESIGQNTRLTQANLQHDKINRPVY